MSPRKRYSFFIDPDLEEGLKTLKDRDGTSEAEAIRRAIRDYLKKRGISTKTERKRVAARKRP